ncbi:Fe-S cluster assembly ATPase SufC [Ureaplasma zalophigenitalium]|uniref:Fe-S cluster assembly ATPase SufC n=1 Tax=Ureaplasma zalophigenitalium TaxID=907723 RepID=A0ABT3BPM5_9BACT|nr:Fe-S cluster assembly ATPase SufC [Ureaplasma zalophigenitalium]MCV3754153.1 Fe-S cluster assembly ATPase SufC [Ureaplasma zalophigenitalium]
MESIKIQNLSVSIDNELILQDINLSINRGDIIAIMGPNGHGKTTLFKSIMKHFSLTYETGDIWFDETSIKGCETHDIANRKVFLATQNPIEIPGLMMLDFYRSLLTNYNPDAKMNVLELYSKLKDRMQDLALDVSLLQRSFNDNFSGGEKKKNEILQLAVLDPDFIFLDEIDSGLDIDALKMISNILQEQHNKQKAICYISHNNGLLNLIPPTKVILIVNGRIVQTGDIELAEKILREGYGWVETELGVRMKKQQPIKTSSLKLGVCGARK